MRVLAYGPGARLAETGPGDPSPADLARALAGVPGIIDVVPAARTVLVTYDPGVYPSERVAAEEIAAAIHAATDAATCAAAQEPATATARAESEVITIPVTYDGEDLARVAQDAGLSVAEVIFRHTTAEYTASFVGFAPGFAYLSGLDPRLHLPRLESPRPSVAGGSVAIAGEYAAVYPRPSPGGWLLLGRTDVVLFDPDADPPALLAPGTRVRFEAR